MCYHHLMLLQMELLREPLVAALRDGTGETCQILLGPARVPCGAPWTGLRMTLDDRVYRMCDVCHDRQWIPMGWVL